MIHVDFN